MRQSMEAGCMECSESGVTTSSPESIIFLSVLSERIMWIYDLGFSEWKANQY